MYLRGLVLRGENWKREKRGRGRKREGKRRGNGEEGKGGKGPRTAP